MKQGTLDFAASWDPCAFLLLPVQCQDWITIVAVTKNTTCSSGISDDMDVMHTMCLICITTYIYIHYTYIYIYTLYIHIYIYCAYIYIYIVHIYIYCAYIYRMLKYHGDTHPYLLHIHSAYDVVDWLSVLLEWSDSVSVLQRLVWTDCREVYPLVNIQTTMENHIFSWENELFLWPFSIAMLNYQRVPEGTDLWRKHQTSMPTIWVCVLYVMRFLQRLYAAVVNVCMRRTQKQLQLGELAATTALRGKFNKGAEYPLQMYCT